MADIDLEQAKAITSAKEKQYGLPEGTLYKIGGIESSFVGGKVSPKGAQGYFQFMPDTAKAYGLTDPNNFEMAADAAGRYMRDNLKRYGGSMNLALADYNGGPKAASALAKGKPWAETQDYLNKFHGSQTVALPPQFTTGGTSGTNYGPNAGDLVRQDQINQEKYGGFFTGLQNVPEGIKLGFQQDNTVVNWFKQQGVLNEHVDPNYQRTDEYTKEYLKGIPEQHWEYMLQGKSLKQDQALRARMLESMQREQELANLGLAGMGGRLIGGLVDLPTLIAFVPGAGGEGLLTAGSRIGNAVRMGVIGAGTNMAYEALTYKNRPQGTSEDIYMAGLMGLALGAIGGGTVNPERIRMGQEIKQLQDFGLRESAKAHVTEFKQLGFDLTEEGKAIYGRLAQRADDAKVDVFSHITKQADEIKAKYGNAASAAEDLDAISKIRTETAEIPVFSRTSGERIYPKSAKVETASSLLNKVAADNDPLVSNLAVRLQEQLRNDVKVVWRENLKRSFYDPGSNEIHLRKTAQPWVQLHEVAHAVTANKIAYGLQNPNTAHGALVAELQEVFKEAKAAARGQAFTDSKTKYYLKNLDEFVAGIYSGKSEFIDFLGKTKVKDGSTVIAKIVDVFRKLLGMAPDEVNALTKALSITDRMIDQPLKVEQTLIGKKGTRQLDYLMAPDDQVFLEKSGLNSSIFGWGIGSLEYKLMGDKAAASVREGASLVFPTTVGYKDHAVVKRNMWDDTTMWSEAWIAEMRKQAAPAFEDWMKTSGYKWHEQRAAYEDFGTKVSNYVRGFDGDYPPQVIKAGDAIRKQMAKVVDYINNPMLDEGGSKRGLTMQEIRDPETGAVTLEGGLDKNPNYLPRKYDINKWNVLVQNYGVESLEGFFARAHKSVRPEISSEQADKFGKWFVRTVFEAHNNRTQDFLETLMRGQDKEALKQSLKVNGGYSDAEALKVIEDMFPTKAKDTGRPMASLKHRSSINEKYTETWTLADGTSSEVSLNNFIHTNAFDVVEPYLRRTAGSVAMAKYADIYKVGDIDNFIMKYTEIPPGATQAERKAMMDARKDLKFALDRVQGLPLEEFSVLNKTMEMWRSFNVARLMGGAVWNQASEMGQIAGSIGYRAVMDAIPELKGLERDIATGKAPHDILDHLENTIGGAGAEYITRIEFGAKDDWVRNMGDTKMNRWLDTIDTGINKLSKGVLDYTGMTPLMIQQKRLHAIGLVNYFINHANGKLSSSFLTKDRLAWMGMDEAMTARVMDGLQKYSTPTKGEFSRTYKVDWAKFVKEDPEAHASFMNAIHRESRRVIQENDLGSMIPIMGTTLGKTVFQFMNFSLHAWNKSLMFSMNHRDWTTLSSVLHSSFLASIAYMGRTMMGSMGMDGQKAQDYLDKRMTPGQIIANSFGRISQASMLPSFYDTLSPYPMFSGMRTTSDLSSLASNPTYQAINGLLSLKKIVRNATSDELQTTERDVRTWGKLLPLNNIVPISTLLNAVANDYPSSEKE